MTAVTVAARVNAAFAVAFVTIAAIGAYRLSMHPMAVCTSFTTNTAGYIGCAATPTAFAYVAAPSRARRSRNARHAKHKREKYRKHSFTKLFLFKHFYVLLFCPAKGLFLMLLFFSLHWF
jgi:hypothetical protein